MGFDPAGYLAPAHGAEPTLSVVPICPPPMTSYRAAFTYVLNSVTLESQLGGSFDRGPVDVRGLVAYTYLISGWRVGISPSRVPRGVSQPSTPTAHHRWSLSRPLPQRLCRAATCNLGSQPVPTVTLGLSSGAAGWVGASVVVQQGE